MADIQAQAEPKAPPVVDPDASTVALPDATSSQPQPSTPEPEQTPQAVDFDQVDGNAYEELRDQLNAEPPAKAEPTPEPTPEPPTPEVEAQPTEPTEPPAEPEPTPEHEPTEEEEPSARGKDFRPRLGKLPDTQKEAIALVKQLADQGQQITLSEAESRVNAKYGITPGQPPAETAKAPEPTAIQSEIDALKDELKTAAKSADTVRMAEIQVEIEDKRDALAAAKEQAAEANRKASETLTKTVAASKEKAQLYYPDIKDPNSPLSKEWDSVYQELQSLDDPILKTPDAPFRITQMAAARRGTPPINPSKAAAPVATPKASPPTPSNQQPKRTVQPAPGSARSAVPANTTGQLQAKIDGLKSLNDYEAMVEELHAPTA